MTIAGTGTKRSDAPSTIASTAIMYKPAYASLLRRVVEGIDHGEYVETTHSNEPWGDSPRIERTAISSDGEPPEGTVRAPIVRLDSDHPVANPMRMVRSCLALPNIEPRHATSLYDLGRAIVSAHATDEMGDVVMIRTATPWSPAGLYSTIGATPDGNVWSRLETPLDEGLLALLPTVVQIFVRSKDDATIVDMAPYSMSVSRFDMMEEMEILRVVTEARSHSIEHAGGKVLNDPLASPAAGSSSRIVQNIRRLDDRLWLAHANGSGDRRPSCPASILASPSAIEAIGDAVLRRPVVRMDEWSHGWAIALDDGTWINPYGKEI